ncbi:Hypothetical predicted protein [Pelobates cultripes]|uniref:Uncharacterized protein n=1 Tax=Pelobates cultripes TaxID=61616 RepID=A0AAD1R3Q2_PELCU|nr:Hypothetical predicted protein [Pelobates cultripes]
MAGSATCPTCNLPNKDDLRQANTVLQVCILADFQLGLIARVVHIEVECDVLSVEQATTATDLHAQSEQIQAMALHMEDLDNLGRHNNLKIRGQPKTE